MFFRLETIINKSELRFAFLCIKFFILNKNAVSEE